MADKIFGVELKPEELVLVNANSYGEAARKAVWAMVRHHKGQFSFSKAKVKEIDFSRSPDDCGEQTFHAKEILFIKEGIKK